MLQLWGSWAKGSMYAYWQVFLCDCTSLKPRDSFTNTGVSLEHCAHLSTVASDQKSRQGSWNGILSIHIHTSSIPDGVTTPPLSSRLRLTIRLQQDPTRLA